MQPADIIHEDLKLALDLTSEAWEEMRRGRIFMTGGTGLVGRWLLESFAPPHPA